MFTRMLAMELAEQRINVNCIAHGYIKVDSGTPPLSSDFRGRAHQEHPVGAAFAGRMYLPLSTPKER